jgi:hypothetical protein
VAQETLNAAEAKATQLRDCLGAAQNSRAVLDQEILALTDAIGRANALRGELEKQRAEHAVYHGLALDLRSDRFQAFLLEETFRELVSGASARLWDLTKRYRFDCRTRRSRGTAILGTLCWREQDSNFSFRARESALCDRGAPCGSRWRPAA